MELNYSDICIFLLVFLLVLYYYGIKSYNHFKNTDIKSIKPSIPYFGSVSSVFFRREGFYEFFKRIYDKYPDEKYIGLFEGRKPLIMLKDPDLIKSIGIKNFDIFHDRRTFTSGDPKDLLSYILTFMKGDKWRNMRAALSPAFTSSKMKNMFIFMEECAKDTTQFFINQKEVKDKKIIEINVKDALSRFTSDVIANAVFGFKINSLENRDNDMYRLGLSANTMTFKRMLTMYTIMFLPKLANLFKISFFSRNMVEYFGKLVKNAIKGREKMGLIRPDMINLLMEAKKGTLIHDKDEEIGETGFATVEESEIGKLAIKKKWTDTELTAQAFVFFLAGFETTSTMMTFFFHEMVRNPEVQDKLQREIDEHLKKSDGKFGYQDVLQLKYLDMCLSETLRMWPPLAALERVCSSTLTLPPPNNRTTKTYQIQKNQLVWIPVYGMTRDPKYFPNPEKFDPERFSDENKSSIDPVTYLPFGIGPRNCIGSRFALLEMKILIFHMLSKFTIVPVDKTEIPITLQKGILQTMLQKPFYVGLKSR